MNASAEARCDDDATFAAAARAERELLQRRLRTGSAVILAASVVFLAVDLLHAHEHVAPLVLVKALQCAILAVGVLAVPRTRNLDAMRWLGAVMVCALYATTAASAALRGEIIASAFLYVATAMATASFVPWGPWPQALTVVVACGGLLVTRALLPDPADATLTYRSLAVGLALFGSVWVAREHEVQRRERRRAERGVATESRISSALARAGEEMIRCESTPVILDRVCQLVVELLRCDAGALVLRDAGDNAFVPHTAHGHREEDWQAVRDLRVPTRDVEPLLALLASSGATQIETRDIEDPRVRELHARHRIGTSLYVALRRGGEIMGIISAHYVGDGRRFGREQERVAVGIAHLASLALENTRLLEELREANRIKSEFVSTMSHELRTPVSVILGYTEMLGDDVPGPERTRILHRIRRSGVELLELIEETLNLSRLEAGRDPPRYERVRLRELFTELAAEFAAMVPLDEVALRWDGPDDLELDTDPRKLRIILKNLIGNAVKFTPRGEVVLECRPDAGLVRCVVRDTGIGIAPQHLPIIFDMFRQADSSDARSYRGAGLGLYIARRLVHQLGGEISVASELGRGSSFIFTLPRGTSAPSFPTPPAADPAP
ncbi:MAG: HAMP domain-containing sensor histidine kinase [Thermodesulfobacteriota bacterium]